MIPQLSAALQMFLISISILMLAIAFARTDALKTLISLMALGTRVKTHKLEMSLWFAAFRILLADALTQNLRVASDTYTFMSLDPSLVSFA